MSKLGKIKIWRKEEKRRVEYEPRNVREILKEMKGISELIVDLSYSAILFNNEDLVEEVKYLEARMDTLNYEIRMQTMLAARDAEDAEKLAGILQVAEAAETISNAAADITDITKLKLERPLIPSLFKESYEIIVRIKVGPYAYGKSASELRIRSKTGCKIIAMRRGDSWVFAPKNEPFVEGDVAVVRGTKEGVEKLKRLLVRGSHG